MKRRYTGHAVRDSIGHLFEKIVDFSIKYLYPLVLFTVILNLVLFSIKYVFGNSNSTTGDIMGKIVNGFTLFGFGGVMCLIGKFSHALEAWKELFEKQKLRWLISIFVLLPIFIVSLLFQFGIVAAPFTLMLPQTTYKSGLCGEGSKFYAGKNASYILENGVLTISGKGDIRNDAFSSNLYRKPFCDSVQSVIIEEGIQKIGKRAFRRCKNISSVSFPSSLTNIEEEAFRGCTSLTEIDLTKSETESFTLERAAFMGCTSLKTLLLPKGIETVSESAFEKCGSLSDLQFPPDLKIIEKCAFKGSALLGIVDIPDKLAILGESAFEGCDTITEVKVNSTEVIEIGNGAFSNCDTLSEVSISSKLRVDTLGDSIFEGCTRLKTVTLPENLLKIGKQTFKGCESLEKINLSDRAIEEIGDSAFDGCTMLVSINLPETLKSLGEEVFSECRNLREVYFAGGVPDGFSEKTFRNHRPVFSTYFNNEYTDVWQKYLETANLDFDVKMKFGELE